MPREMPNFENASPQKIGEVIERAMPALEGQLEQMGSSLVSAMKKGKRPKEIFDISPDSIEYFYAEAYRFYNQGKYKEALYLFQILSTLDPGVPRYLLGSAACLHRLGKYEAAGKIYLISAPYDPENPLPYFHAADCYIKMKVYEMAEFHLDKCLELCKDKDQFKLVSERASMMLEAVKAEIAREDKELEEKERQEKEKQQNQPDQQNKE